MKTINKVLTLSLALALSSASALANPPTAKDNGVGEKSDDCVQATARDDKGGSGSAAAAEAPTTPVSGGAHAPVPATK
jgi:hypothetical protein